ncbi:MAG: glycosyltransferase family 2 protein [Bacteroidales bacterium]
MDENKTIEISLVIPIFNEEENIGELYRRLKLVLDTLTPSYEILFINDGSKDSSLTQLIHLAQTDSRIVYLNFSRNFGHQVAVMAGLDYSKGEVVIIMDADLQDPPELISELYSKYQEGYQVVYGQRAKREGETLFKKLSAKCFYRILKKMTALDIPLDTGDFRLISRRIVDLLKEMPEKNKFLRGQIAWLGFRQTGVSYIRQERLHGQSAYPLNKMLHLAMDGITSFSDKPLAWVTFLGISMSSLTFLIILYALYSHFILEQTMSGWTSLIISVMFLGGIQLISIGIIGQYISRITKDVRQRPLYIVESTNQTTGSKIQ